jgi:uncharacterized integral membrane protein (TIGR00698 family)
MYWTHTQRNAYFPRVTAIPLTARLPDGRRLLPGIIASIAVSLVSVAGGWLQNRWLGRPVFEPLVLAIIIGMIARAIAGESADREPGVRFVGKEVLEVAVLLLGATLDPPKLFASGPSLAIAIVTAVVVALPVGFSIGRAVGLPPRLALLVSCGNAICGNSAIAAVAPVIGADREDVAASISLTAVLGVTVVLTLPLLVRPLGYSQYQYGVLAGLTVYAVPQVLAAAFAVSVVSGQVATVVKLARVLMLGPVVVFFSLRRRRGAAAHERTARPVSFLPWFVVGFVLLAIVRSVGLLPELAISTARVSAQWLTVAAMAALGLSVDFASVKRVGARVAVAAVGSLLTLLVVVIGLISALGIR